ncbi:UNVERIFIED_CONTAM: hypothetical protein FKN15_051987 [Acipenser sinensis]
MFYQSDPDRFGTMFNTIFTLFQLLTLDDWSYIYTTSREREVDNVQKCLFDCTAKKQPSERQDGNRCSLAHSHNLAVPTLSTAGYTGLPVRGQCVSRSPPCLRFYPCETCKARLHIEDKHGRCLSCLGPEHAKEALANRSFCEFCAPFSKRTLEKRLSRSSKECSAWPQEDMLSITASEEVGEQERTFLF